MTFLNLTLSIISKKLNVFQLPMRSFGVRRQVIAIQI